MPIFQQRLNRFFKAPKVRTSHDVFTGLSLFKELYKENVWRNNTLGMAFKPPAIHEYLRQIPSSEKIFRKHISNFDKIIERGTGISLYPFSEPVNIGKIGTWVNKAHQRATMRHETFHRAIYKYVSRADFDWHIPYPKREADFLENLFGKDLSIRIAESRGGKSIKAAYGNVNMEEYTARYFTRRGVVKSNLGKNTVFSEALEKIKSDSVMGKWFDSSGRRFSYYKMKEYLGEPTGAKAVSTIMKKHVSLGNKTSGLVNNILHNNKVNHTIASVTKKVAHLFKVK